MRTTNWLLAFQVILTAVLVLTGIAVLSNEIKGNARWQEEIQWRVEARKRMDALDRELGRIPEVSADELEHRLKTEDNPYALFR